MRYFIILFLGCFPFIQKGYSQDDILIDPIEILCYELHPQGPIKVFKSKSDYVGRVVVQVEIDTTKLRLINHKIMFAKLRSTANPTDSIEVRIDEKSGNYQMLEEMTPAIVQHFEYIKVKKASSDKCALVKFTLPLRIE